MANYWEQEPGRGRTNTPAPVDPETERRARIAALVQELQTRQNTPDKPPAGYARVLQLSPPNNMLGAKGLSIDMPVGDRTAPKPDDGVSLGDFKLPENLMAGFGAAGQATAQQKNPWDILKGVASNVLSAGTAGATNTPAWILSWLQDNAPQAQYGGPSPEEMANRQFDPIFGALDKQQEQQGTRYNSAADKAKQSYAAYVRSLEGDKAANQQTYAGAGKELGSNYDEAAQSISGNSAKSFNSLSDTLKRLGIQEGADELAAQNQTQVNEQLGTLGQNRQAATNLNTQLGANTAAYDTARVGNGRQAGLNYQGDLLDQYTDQLNQNDQQRLQLQGQKGAALNEYDMAIQKIMAEMQGNAQDSVSSQFEALMGTRKDDQQAAFQQQQFAADQQNRASNLELDRSRLDLDATKAGIGVSDPYTTLLQATSSKVGTGQAQQYMTTIMNAIKQNPQAENAAQLLAGMSEEDLRKPYMAELAYQFFDKALK